MAHFAEIENNIVKQTIVVDNFVIDNKEFPESEPIGIAYCKSLYGENTEWLQTSYNEKFRGKYANKGLAYDPDKDEFFEPIVEIVIE
jgi:hypothetical protein